MRCCFRPPARASTCSVTTGIGEKCFAWRWRESSMLRSISPGRAPPAEYDSGVLWAALLLLTFGMVMVYSSSIAMAEASKFTGGKSAYFLERHALFLTASLFAGMVAFQVPVRLWQQAAPWLFVLGVALLALLLAPGLGREVNGARRWLSLGPVKLQPSEFMKLFVVLYAADYTVRKLALMHSFKRGLLPTFAVMLVVGWFAPDDGGGLRRTGPVFPVPHAADLRLHGSLVGSVRPRLPAFARAHRIRPRRMVRRRIGGERREAPLSPGSAYRLPARGDRRRAGIRGGDRGNRALFVAGAAGIRHRPPGGGPGAPVPGAGRSGDRGVVWGAVVHQHGREHGRAAHQVPHASVHELRRERPACELPGARGADADRLGESPAHARSPRMSGATPSWREPS